MIRAAVDRRMSEREEEAGREARAALSPLSSSFSSSIPETRFMKWRGVAIGFRCLARLGRSRSTAASGVETRRHVRVKSGIDPGAVGRTGAQRGGPTERGKSVAERARKKWIAWGKKRERSAQSPPASFENRGTASGVVLTRSTVCPAALNAPDAAAFVPSFQLSFQYCAVRDAVSDSIVRRLFFALVSNLVMLNECELGF